MLINTNVALAVVAAAVADAVAVDVAPVSISQRARTMQSGSVSMGKYPLKKIS